LKVVLSTAGRFHIFALAKELQALGHLSHVFTGFPWFAVKREGIERSRVTTFPYVRSFLMGSRFLPFQFSWATLDYVFQLSVVAQDIFVSRHLGDCDVFVGHECVGLISGRVAQARGALYVCDRGCSHVEWAYELMREECERAGLRPILKPRTLQREMAEYELSDLLAVPSTYAAKSMAAKGIPTSKVVLAPYGADVSQFHAARNPTVHTADVLYVGRVNLRKGAHDLFEAFSQLRIPNKRLIIAGVIEKEVTTRYRRELSRPDVVCLGQVSRQEVGDLMRNSLVLALPSIDEGFGMVLAEALACGCPIIATDHTGAPDLIEHGREGFITPIRSPELIVEYIEMLWRDPDRRIEMGRAGRRRMESLGGWANYAAILVKAYAEAIGAKAASKA